VFSPAFCGIPEQRAVDYLAREVPRWSIENKCFSCHNNGDGARALYAAVQSGYSFADAALTDTNRWLIDPSGWSKGRADASISDKKLARIQFAAALTDAGRAGQIQTKESLTRAAEALLADQEKDGSWQIDAEDNVGSPATWGTTLATVMARSTLAKVDGAKFREASQRATVWLNAAKPRSILDIAATLIGVPARSAALIPPLITAQTKSGGWGPWPNTPPEPFDTAVAILALQSLNESSKTAEAVKRGRSYLVATQQKNGGWPETTRPAGSQSYAQHISTSAWATLALLATDQKRK
jgi:squalene cyclase